MPERFAWSRVRVHWGPLLVIGAVSLWAGLPALVAVFGYNDDYHLLLRGRTGTLDFWRNEFVEGGRYLLSPLVVAAYRSLGTVSDLAVLRGLSLTGIVVLAGAFYFVAFQSLGRRLPAMMLALLLALSPAAAVWLGWAVCFSYPWIAALGLLGGYAAWRMSAGWRRPSTIALWILTWGLFLLLLFSLYQPNGAYWLVGFWLGFWWERRIPGLSAETPPPEGPSPLLRLSGACVQFVTAAVAYLVVFRALRSWLATGGQAIRGETPLASLPDRLQWILQEYYPRGAAGWAMLGAEELFSFAAVLGGVLALIALGARRRGEPWGPYAAGRALTLLVLSLVLLPMVGAAERMIALRVMGPFLTVLMVLNLEGRVRAVSFVPAPPRWSFPIAAAILITWSAAGTAQFRFYLSKGFVEPSQHEFAQLRRQLHERIPAFPAQAAYRYPPEHVPDSRFFTTFAEFGTYSSYQSWVAPSMIQLILEDRFGGPHPMIDLRTEAGFDDSASVPLVSALEAVAGSPLEIREDPYWGRVEVYPENWLYSPWFGVFNATRFPGIKHSQHEFLASSGKPAEGGPHYFYDYRLRKWFYTRPEDYPFLWVAEDNRKLRFLGRVEPGRTFIDPATGEHLRGF